jgi:hypothetical protein
MGYLLGEILLPPAASQVDCSSEHGLVVPWLRIPESGRDVRVRGCPRCTSTQLLRVHRGSVGRGRIG